MSNVINVWDQTTEQWINVPALSGDPGIHIGTSMPTDPNKKVWIDPSGAADIEYKIYNSVTDLGLTSGSATIVEAYAAMTMHTILICLAEQFASSELPSGFAGTIEIVRSANSYRGWINLYGDIASRGDYRMFINSGVPTGTWVLTMGDTGWVDCRSENITAGTLNYRIKNNILYLQGNGLAYQAQSGSVVVGYLPLTFNNYINYYARTGYNTCQAWIQLDGTIIIAADIANPTGIAVFYAGPLD